MFFGTFPVDARGMFRELSLGAGWVVGGFGVLGVWSRVVQLVAIVGRTGVEKRTLGGKKKSLLETPVCLFSVGVCRDSPGGMKIPVTVPARVLAAYIVVAGMMA